MGTFELTRCYWSESDGRYVVAPADTTRLGPFTCIGADLTERGLTLTFTDGVRVFIPETRIQASYRL